MRITALEKLRLEAGYTQAEVASLLKKTQKTVSAQERTELPMNIRTLKEYASLYGITISLLLLITELQAEENFERKEALETIITAYQCI